MGGMEGETTSRNTRGDKDTTLEEKRRPEVGRNPDEAHKDDIPQAPPALK